MIVMTQISPWTLVYISDSRSVLMLPALAAGVSLASAQHIRRLLRIQSLRYLEGKGPSFRVLPPITIILIY